MEEYVENYIKEIAKELNIKFEDLMNLICNEYEKEYGVNVKRLASLHKLSVINYCFYKDTTNNNYLFRLALLADKIKRIYFK